MDAVPDDGRVAATRAREGGVRGSREHAGKARFAESMPAVEKQRHSLLLVVPQVANRAARDLHSEGFVDDEWRKGPNFYALSPISESG